MSLIKQFFPNNIEDLTLVGTGASTNGYDYLSSGGSGGAKYNRNVYVNTTSMSFSVWFYFNSIKSTHLLDMRINSGTGYQPIFIDGSKIQYHVIKNSNGNNWEFAHGGLSNNTWYNIIISCSNTGVSCFLNGTQLGTEETKGVSPLPLAGKFPLYIGSRFEDSTPYYLNGKIKDVRIYDHILTAYERDQIQKDFNPYLTCNYNMHTKGLVEETSLLMAKYHCENSNFVENEYLYLPDLISDPYLDIKSGVKRVSYIRGTGSQYINTGITAGSNDSFLIEYEFVYDVLEADEKKSYYNQIMGFSGHAGCGIGAQGHVIWESNKNIKLKTGKHYIHRWYMNAGTGEYFREVNGQRVGETSNSLSGSLTSGKNILYLFAAFDPSSSVNKIGYHCCGKMYYCKISKNGELIRDYIPCKSGSTYTLYDRCNSQVASTSGTFSGGNEAKYLKIFYHDILYKNEFFTSIENSKKEIGPNRFSRLEDLNGDAFKSKKDGKYEFILNYPQAQRKFAQGEYSDTNIVVDFSQDINLNFEVVLDDDGQNHRRIICGNYAGDDKALNIEITGQESGSYKNNCLRLYINGAGTVDTADQNVQFSNGTYSCSFIYMASNREYLCTMGDARISGILPQEAQSSYRVLRIGAKDYRDGDSPFYPISCRILYPKVPTNGNRWRQNYSPFKVSDLDDAKYEALNVSMKSRWGSYPKVNGEDAPNNTGENYSNWGLGIDTSGNCLLDCQPEIGHWHGGLGQHQEYPLAENQPDPSKRGFPAPDGIIYKQAELWVRVDNTNYDAYSSIEKCKNSNFIWMTNNFIEEQY